MTLTDVAVDLYAVPPADFVAARTARVRQLRADGDRALATQVSALRKPSLAAWAVNLLVRRRPDQVEELLALGARLREAQSTLAGDELRELDRRRHAAMAAIRAEAHALAADLGRPFGDAVDAPLESTLRAAMTDPAAAAAVRAGMLVGDLTSSGFGPVELGDAVAVPDAPSLTGAPRRVGEPAAAGPGAPAPPESVTVPGRARRGSPGPERDAASTPRPPRRSTGRSAATTAAPGPVPQPARPTDDDAAAARRGRLEREAAARETARRREREAALADVEDALGRAAEADAELAAAKAAVADVARRRTALVSEVERLTAELAAAQAAVSAAVVEERHARTARETAVRAASTAARRALSARERLDRLA